jgi:hypothetical protein
MSLGSTALDDTGKIAVWRDYYDSEEIAVKAGRRAGNS